MLTNFQEFGSSGREWSRDQVVDLLATEEDYQPASIHDFKCEVLTGDIALVTYRALGAHASLRSSLWRKTEGVWHMRFQLGKPDI